MKKKKFLCFFLVLMLCFSSTISAYASSGDHGGGGSSIDESSSGEGDFSYVKNIGSALGELFARAATATTELVDGALSGFDSFLSDHLSGWLEKGYIKANPDKYVFLPECVNEINDYLRQYVSELDGYYLVTPSVSFDDAVNSIVNRQDYSSEQRKKLVSLFHSGTYNIMGQDTLNSSSWFCFPSDTLFYIDLNSATIDARVIAYKHDIEVIYNSSGSSYPYLAEDTRRSIFTAYNKRDVSPQLPGLVSRSSGLPFKIFKSYQLLTKYISDGKNYVAELPSTISIPKKYIDDPTLLPDITYNVDKSNKTENTIQNEYNTIINNYITNLGGSSSGGSSGGDSGNTGGGSSSGGSSGGGSNITDTELYDFLTKLWNESDKKFDKMIDLLETNNKYQKKLVDSLNDIKAILVTEAVFNAFKDRSSQTADKAKDKFPTSIPWDVAMIINAMSAEPEQLKFSLPIQVKSIGINETIDIDLSSEEWEKLAKTCRYLLSLTFILFLIHLTRKMFGGGDD